MKPILEVKEVWKEYQRGAQKERYLSLRDNILRSFKPSKKKESFWALEDINFEVYPGDSLAIIGKNGAGKSTLLKILSRITPPTRGEITLRGRLASLLEVGTGFHPELTGRENIYLNGSILGLGRGEIKKQFDAIVDFSGVETFLDTPLKHYSSGMQLRLAFAVAAHLEPEILVIDEVLAVGDSVFQQKCINKMTEVSKSGRTILFVSHNTQAIKKLCDRAILLDHGKLVQEGSAGQIVDTYLNENILKEKVLNLKGFSNRKGRGNIVFSEFHFEKNQLNVGELIVLEIQLATNVPGNYADLDIGIGINDSMGTRIIHLSNKYIGKEVDHSEDNSVYRFSVSNELKSGTYSITLFLKANDEIEDWIQNLTTFAVLEGNRYGYANSKEISGLIQPDFSFHVS